MKSINTIIGKYPARIASSRLNYITKDTIIQWGNTYWDRMLSKRYIHTNLDNEDKHLNIVRELYAKMADGIRHTMCVHVYDESTPKINLESLTFLIFTPGNMYAYLYDVFSVINVHPPPGIPKILRDRICHPGMVLYDLLCAGYDGIISMNNEGSYVYKKNNRIDMIGYYTYLVYDMPYKISYKMNENAYNMYCVP